MKLSILLMDTKSKKLRYVPSWAVRQKTVFARTATAATSAQTARLKSVPQLVLSPHNPSVNLVLNSRCVPSTWEVSPKARILPKGSHAWKNSLKHAAQNLLQFSPKSMVWSPYTAREMQLKSAYFLTDQSSVLT